MISISLTRNSTLSPNNTQLSDLGSTNTVFQDPPVSRAGKTTTAEHAARTFQKALVDSLTALKCWGFRMAVMGTIRAKSVMLIHSYVRHCNNGKSTPLKLSQIKEGA